MNVIFSYVVVVKKIDEDEDKNNNNDRDTFHYILDTSSTKINFISNTKCNETKLHIHKYENKCEVCDHNLVTFKYDLSNNIEDIIVYYFKPILLLIDSLYTTPNYNTSPLRAPPAFHFL